MTVPRPGLKAIRLKENPREAAFKAAWESVNYRSPVNDDAHTVLGYILTPPEVDQRYPHTPSERDWLVANTVIQWLGTSVGHSFLRQAGYINAQEAQEALKGNRKALDVIADLVKP